MVRYWVDYLALKTAARMADLLVHLKAEMTVRKTVGMLVVAWASH